MAPRPKAIFIAIAIVSCIQTALPTNTHATCISTHTCIRTYVHTCVFVVFVFMDKQQENAMHFFCTIFVSSTTYSSLFTLPGNYMRMHVHTNKYIHICLHMCLDTVDGLYCLLFVLFCCFYCYLHRCDTRRLHCVGASESHNN